MARSDVDSNDVPQGQNGGDIEMGESHIVQAEAAQSSPQEATLSSPPAEAQQSSPQVNEILIATPPSSSPTSPLAPQAQAAQPTRGALFEEKIELSVKLYKAALNGDWETLEDELRRGDPREILYANITKYYETILHVAAGARQAKFVEKLMKLMEPVDLELQDKNGNTAFCLAAATGAKSIAEVMIKVNPNLPKVRGNSKVTPLYLAAVYGKGDMVRFLDHKTEEIHDQTEFLTQKDRKDLFFAYIDIGLFDLALKLLGSYPWLAWSRDEEKRTALHMLARMPSAFPIESPGIWKKLINSCKTSNQTDHALELVRAILKKGALRVLTRIRRSPALLFEAAKLGNFKFLAELVRFCPDLIWEEDKNRQTIFHFAVLHRRVNIFNQIHNMGSIKDKIAEYESKDGSRNNILHLAAKLPNQSRLNEISGAALQMQRELIWFQEVEKIVQPSSREKKNEDNLTPRELFSEEHEKLLTFGESWMRDRAKVCMLVATIITTVVFSAAFNLPGGNNDTGTPNLLEKTWFQVFALSNAIAFSCSLFSTLLFFSILTSRYTEKDFLKLLPYKLMAGLLTLFIAMIAMIAAFSAAYIVAYNDEKRWAPILISATAFLPAAIFVWLQCSLFFGVFKSTFFSKSLFQPGKSMI